MISKGDKRFNCCESTLLRIDEGRPLPGFDEDLMRLASAFGGGVMGWGSVCGAVSGASMALGLIYGTEGEEPTGEYDDIRSDMREFGQVFMSEFEREFGSVNCRDLLGIDRRTEEGKKRFEELRSQGVLHCGDYVEWASNKIFEMLKNFWSVKSEGIP